MPLEINSSFASLPVLTKTDPMKKIILNQLRKS